MGITCLGTEVTITGDWLDTSRAAVAATEGVVGALLMEDVGRAATDVGNAGGRTCWS
jgi:hypothetical protein